jgi:hypothetical protein
MAKELYTVETMGCPAMKKVVPIEPISIPMEVERMGMVTVSIRYIIVTGNASNPPFITLCGSPICYPRLELNGYDLRRVPDKDLPPALLKIRNDFQPAEQTQPTGTTIPAEETPTIQHIM